MTKCVIQFRTTVKFKGIVSSDICEIHAFLVDFNSDEECFSLAQDIVNDYCGDEIELSGCEIQRQVTLVSPLF